MPIIYLSPSTQEFNPYINTGNEEEWMNLLADRMEPYLNANGIRYVRNTPSMTSASSIKQSNQGDYDLHLALHSNASPEGESGTRRGIIALYYPSSLEGEDASQQMAENLKSIYPLPNQVYAQPSTTIGELRLVKAPSVFLELGYHDNPDDAVWLQTNLDLIAQTIVRSLAEYFGLPYLRPQISKRGVVDITSGYLNIRSRPELDAAVVAKAYDGAPLTILNTYGDWYLVQFGNAIGYAFSDFVTLI